MNAKETSLVLSTIAALWPEFKYSGTPMIGAWAQLFAQNACTLPEVQAALSKLASSGKQFAPNAPEVIAAVKDVRAASGPRELTPEERWAGLVALASKGFSIATAIRRCSARTWRALEFAGGWQALKTADKDTSLPFMRQAFLRAYESSERADITHEASTAAIEHTQLKQLVSETARRLEAK